MRRPVTFSSSRLLVLVWLPQMANGCSAGTVCKPAAPVSRGNSGFFPDGTEFSAGNPRFLRGAAVRSHRTHRVGFRDSRLIELSSAPCRARRSVAYLRCACSVSDKTRSPIPASNSITRCSRAVVHYRSCRTGLADKAVCQATTGWTEVRFAAEAQSKAGMWGFLVQRHFTWGCRLKELRLQIFG